MSLILDDDKNIVHNRNLSLFGGASLTIMLGTLSTRFCELTVDKYGFFITVSAGVIITWLITEILYNIYEFTYNGIVEKLLAVWTGIRISALVFMAALFVNEWHPLKGIAEQILKKELPDSAGTTILLAITGIAAVIATIVIIVIDDYLDFEDGLVTKLLKFIFGIPEGIESFVNDVEKEKKRRAAKKKFKKNKKALLERVKNGETEGTFAYENPSV